MIVDSKPWGAKGTEKPSPRFLDVLQDAVIQGVQAQLGYIDSSGKEFDLAASWRELTDEAERHRNAVEVHANCDPEGLSFLQAAVGDNLRIGPAAHNGRIPVVIHAPSEYGIAGHLAGLVEWLEITSPQSVRNHLAEIGAALTGRYAKRVSSDTPKHRTESACGR